VVVRRHQFLMIVDRDIHPRHLVAAKVVDQLVARDRMKPGREQRVGA
jgi:hypothetical protein